MLMKKSKYSISRASELCIPYENAKDAIRQALSIYSETNLDYVDSLLVAEALSSGAEILSFDKKLLNELKRKM